MNWGSILEKAKEYMNSESGKRLKDKAISDFMMGKSTAFFRGASGTGVISPDVASDHFVRILQEEIRKSIGSDYASGNIGADIANVIIGSIVKGVVYRDGPYFAIDIYFDMDKHRPSLSSKSDDLDNVIAALNAGWSTQYYVRGTWHGNKIRSLIERDEAGFVQRAVERFEREYGRACGLVRIEYPEYETDY